tara:strand:- start:1332 stop:2084 length:753 start_codon:yes stop_codon:yes gene_type:complete
MGLRTKLRKFFYRKKFQPKNINLEIYNQNILITGANSGLGLALTQELIKLNNKVYATYKKNSDNLSRIDNENLILIRCDQSSDQEFKKLEDDLLSTKLNLIFNCAGILGPSVQNIKDFNFKEMSNVMMVNSYSILKIIKIILNQDHPLRALVNISSEGGSIGLNNDALYYMYRTSKSSLNSITKSLSIILQKEKKGICFAVDPGNMKSGMNPGGFLEASDCAKNILQILSENDHSLNGKFIDLLKNEIPW